MTCIFVAERLYLHDYFTQKALAFDNNKKVSQSVEV